MGILVAMKCDIDGCKTRTEFVKPGYTTFTLPEGWVQVYPNAYAKGVAEWVICPDHAKIFPPLPEKPK
jgi:hypothetical protein